MTIAIPDPFEGLAFQSFDHATLASVPDGCDGFVLAQLARRQKGRSGTAALYVARDAGRLRETERALAFFDPSIPSVSLPAWDCLPYDRVSPNPTISARRVNVLATIAKAGDALKGGIVFTTVNGILQRLPEQRLIASLSRVMAPGNRVDMDDLTSWLGLNGYLRTSTVREQGDFAVRGGIVDLFAPGSEAPVRLDFFGDTLESIRTFDADSQRTTGQVRSLSLVPVSEIVLTPETIARFRRSYVSAFGAAGPDDALYQSVSEGRRHGGFEHWAPLFYERMETLFDYVPDVPVILDHLADDAVKERLDQIADHYEARREALDRPQTDVAPYKPVAPDQLYLDEREWRTTLADRKSAKLSAFAVPTAGGTVLDFGGKVGRSFAAERAAGDVNVFDALVTHIKTLQEAKKRPVLACWSEGSRDRLTQVLADHGLTNVKAVEDWPSIGALGRGTVPLVVLEIEAGFEIGDMAVIAEQDILGERLVRPRRKSKRASDFLSEVGSLAEGDIVVHVDHGIGRFVGLESVDAAGAPHDCLEIHYHGGDKLFLPVENIELLSRYGSEDTEVQLDRLGGGNWQARKARMKKRIREIADDLIKIAAARALRTATKVAPQEGLYDEFAAQFPYEETDDQQAAIDSVFADLASGHPMDRLICGDVGFGKTEVALRAAFVTALSGRQVAVVVPTTLLARQHYKTFSERFRGLPIQVHQASRLVSTKDLSATKSGLKDGSVDIVVGTHALLGKSIEFRDLGLLIVDEEQHFGVKHKERLKELKTDVHVLTLSATPIPRTMQLALTGVRELSLIATPPVDRLAVRTFVSPFDGLVIREALLRERYRGGQAFYVCPRIADLAEVREFLEANVPEVKVAVAHGQMAAGTLEDVMTAFYEGRFDVLLSTTIVESGLDIPTANTLIVHRADMFGLSQLYQLRGRVGRSKTRAYALFTVPANKTLTVTAERRLKVLQSLDGLGAGFQLASHDMDIRGAGNLLGEEQSGHIKEVGFELYQQMLEEAVSALRSGEEAFEESGQWSPQITVGMPVMIPESYVPDLHLRLSLYRRLADLGDATEIDAFGAELIDRFGPLPDEVEALLKIVFVKALCRTANIAKVDAGPKGVVLTLRDNTFPNPQGLVGYIAEQGSLAKIRPDHKIVLIRDWEKPEQRLKGAGVILSKLARLAEQVGEAA
ncbi:MAG: transcription-repair coupling factor [Pseudomonadota bacterium]